MRYRKNVLNNMMMDNNRGNQLYQTLITDLAIQGIIPRDKAEMLLGYTIPEYLHTPDDKFLAAVETTKVEKTTKQEKKEEKSTKE